ncbi:MAG: hypothetical protein P1U34_01920 [Coxiellaceae bacterium]|nr:hypothetical protein [Coxiellaceae bacterium]
MEAKELNPGGAYRSISNAVSHRQRKRQKSVVRTVIGFSIIAASTALAYLGQRQWLDNNSDIPSQLPVFFTVSVFFLVSAVVEFTPLSKRCNRNTAALSPYRTAHKGYARSIASDTRLNKRMILYLLLLSGTAWMDFSQCFVAAWEVVTSNFDIVNPDSNFDHFLYASSAASGVFIGFHWGMALLQLYWCQASHQDKVDDIKEQSHDMQSQYKSLLLPLTFQLKIPSDNGNEILQKVNLHLECLNEKVALQIKQLVLYDKDRQQYIQCNARWVIQATERLIYGVFFAFRSIYLYGDLLRTNSIEAVREMIKHGGAIVLFSYYIYMNCYMSSEIDQRKRQLEDEYRSKVVNNLRLLKDNVIASMQLLNKLSLPVPLQLRDVITAGEAKAISLGHVGINKQLDACLEQMYGLLEHYEQLHNKTKIKIYFECCADIRLILAVLSENDYLRCHRQSRYLERRDNLAARVL